MSCGRTLKLILFMGGNGGVRLNTKVMKNISTTLKLWLEDKVSYGTCCLSR